HRDRRAQAEEALTGSRSARPRGQLVRAATGGGANYEDARGAESRGTDHRRSVRTIGRRRIGSSEPGTGKENGAVPISGSVLARGCPVIGRLLDGEVVRGGR